MSEVLGMSPSSPPPIVVQEEGRTLMSEALGTSPPLPPPIDVQEIR